MSRFFFGMNISNAKKKVKKGRRWNCKHLRANYWFEDIFSSL